MAIAEVASQRATAEFSGDSGTLAFPANVASGDLLIVAGTAYDATTPPTDIVVTDTRSTSYSVLSAAFDEGADTIRIFIAYGLAPSSGACTVTVNPEGATAGVCFFIDEFSGVHATPLDVDGGSTRQTGTTLSDTLTTITEGALLIGACSWLSTPDPGTLTPGADYTQIGEVEAQTNQAGGAVFRLVTTAQLYTVDWTLNVAPSIANYAYTAAFKPAGVAAGARWPNPNRRPRPFAPGLAR